MTDFFKKESDHLKEFKSEQTIIINKKYIEDISRVHLSKKCETKPPSVDWYPFTNSFYPFTEDVDVYSRVNHVLSIERRSDSLADARGCNNCKCADDAYCEKEAQRNYMSSTPTSFFILGKPGIGQEQLGQQLADYWNCVYIEPETLIRDEIDNDSVAGKCIEFNLRNGRSISADTVLKLLEKRVKSQTAQHRGFVVCGFPLIPNDLFEEEFLTTDSAFLNVHETCDEVFDNVIELGIVPESQEPEEVEIVEDEDLPLITREEISNKTPVDLGSEASEVCITGNYKQHFEEQLDFLFAQFQKPFIVIYLICSNADVITKHECQKFDVHSQQLVDLQLEDADKMIYTYFSQVPGAVNDEVPEDFIDTVKNTNMPYTNDQQRQLVSLPKDWPDNMVTLLDRYRQSALPTIERYVLSHDLENFIRVDGRTSSVRIFHAIKQRLNILPLQRVITPKTFVTPADPTTEAPPESDGLNFEGLTMDECFGVLLKKQAPSSMFKWTLSDWGFKCPVTLKDGIEKDGDPKYAVHFMNKIFFLADEDCFVRFKRNPRPFLLSLCPQPHYKICVMGPRCSGKSAVARCLAYVYDCKILKLEQMLQDFLKSKLAQYEFEIRSAAQERAIEILNEKRLIEWQEKEKDRLEKVDAFMVKWKAQLLRIIKLKKAVQKYEESLVILEISSFPTRLSYREVRNLDEADSLENVEIDKIRKMLADCLRQAGFPETLGLVDFEQMVTDDFNCVHLPEDLQPDGGPIPACPTDEFVCSYVEEAMRNASFANIHLTKEHKVSVLLDGIKKVEEERKCVGFWIVDGMLPDQDLFKALYPDNSPLLVVVLKDHKHEYQGYNDYDDFEKLFYEIGMEEVAWKTRSSTDSYTERTATYVLEDLIDEVVDRLEPDDDRPTHAKEFEEFDKELAAVQLVISEQEIETISVTVTDQPIKAVLKETVRLIENRYRQTATVFTDLDRVQELDDMGEQPEEAVDDEEKNDNEEALLQNRRYGETFYYCPVVFHDHFVLWKGKDEFTVKFDNKVYVLSSESAFENFVTNPRHYLTLDRPPEEIPPPRICIIGPYGSGKSTVAESLSKNLGLYHAKYEQLLKAKIAPKSLMSFHEVLRHGIGGLVTATVREYILNDKALDEDLLKTVIDPLWFDEYQQKHGFVLSGFPKRPSDVAHMIEHCIVPDVVVELSINQGEIRNRLIPKRLAELKAVTQKQRHDEIMTNWQEQYQKRYRELLKMKKTEKQDEETLNRPYMSDLAELDEAADYLEAPETEEMIKEVTGILSLEMPLPELPVEETQLLQMYVNELENQSANELAFLRTLREACTAELVPWITVDAGLSEAKVFAQAMRIVEGFKFRNRSHFERVYEISEELSEKLLETGYYFLSKFGKSCPVQFYEDFNPVHMYLPSKQQFQLYPVAHRQYVYFIAKEENVRKFKQHPLKYLEKKFVHDPLLPLKVAIIGPPKSGKTTLAERFKRDFGMQVISRGKACRYVLNYLKFSKVAERMLALLRVGEQLTDEIVIQAVEACSFDCRCITQGFVLDGFPESVEEVRRLAENGLVPHLVIDLHAVRRFRSNTGKNAIPPYSQQFLDHRYKIHLLHAEDFRKRFDKEYQIAAKVAVRSGKWGTWSECCNLALAAFFEYKHYHRYAYSDYALRLAYMQITPLEFIQRQSAYKHYCPCCLFFNKVFKSGGNPPDRTGLVQFRENFYYLCHDHIELFIEDPEKFISPYNPRELPRDLPEQLTTAGADCEPYSKGHCIICYWTNQPKHVIKPGLESLAVSYRDTVYLFDREECLWKFIQQPHLYFAIKIKYESLEYPPLSLKDLPIQGFLQQYDAQKLIKAITNTGVIRPVVPGLSIATSACLNIGLHLLVNNPKTSTLPYKEGEQKFHERRSNMIGYLARMKKTINPYLYYDEPMPEFVDPLQSENSKSSENDSTSSIVENEDASEDDEFST